MTFPLAGKEKSGTRGQYSGFLESWMRSQIFVSPNNVDRTKHTLPPGSHWGKKMREKCVVCCCSMVQSDSRETPERSRDNMLLKKKVANPSNKESTHRRLQKSHPQEKFERPAPPQISSQDDWWFCSIQSHSIKPGKGCCYKPWMTPGFVASGGEEFNPGPGTRFNYSELFV